MLCVFSQLIPIWRTCYIIFIGKYKVFIEILSLVDEHKILVWVWAWYKKFYFIYDALIEFVLYVLAYDIKKYDKIGGKINFHLACFNNFTVTRHMKSLTHKSIT